MRASAAQHHTPAVLGFSNVMTLKDKLIHAVTQYDIKQSKRAGHNPYALGHYFAAVDNICADIDAGVAPVAAIEKHTLDRFQDVCKRAIL